MMRYTAQSDCRAFGGLFSPAEEGRSSRRLIPAKAIDESQCKHKKHRAHGQMET